MKVFRPLTGSLEEWNAAHYRLDDYLRVHGLRDRIRQSQIVLQLLERAALRHRSDCSQSPTYLAVAEANSALHDWFQFILAANDLRTTRVISEGRMCLYLTDAMERWPQVFLSETALPADFKTEMRNISLASGPDLQISTMIPRPLDDASTVELLDKVWERLSKGAIAYFAAVTGLIGIVWYLM